MCAIDRAQGKKDGQSSLVPLKDAYSAAAKKATDPDAILEHRKQMIRNQMEQISGKIAAIKTQALTAQSTITTIVENALKDLYEVV